MGRSKYILPQICSRDISFAHYSAVVRKDVINIAKPSGSSFFHYCNCCCCHIKKWREILSLTTWHLWVIICKVILLNEVFGGFVVNWNKFVYWIYKSWTDLNWYHIWCMKLVDLPELCICQELYHISAKSNSCFLSNCMNWHGHWNVENLPISYWVRKGIGRTINCAARQQPLKICLITIHLWLKGVFAHYIFFIQVKFISSF